MKAKIQARVNSSIKGDLAKAIPLSTPYSVHIDPCSLCNFKCKFCFQSVDNVSKGTMTDDLFVKIADDLLQFPDKIRKIKIGLHGEPTLHKHLPAMIWYLKNKYVILNVSKVANIVELFTNGSLLNPQLNRSIISAGLDRINISIEGLNTKEYEEITGTKIDIIKFIENIKHLYDNRGNCKIYIKTINQDKDKFYNMFGNICDEIYVENIVPQWAEIGKTKLPKIGMYGQPIKQWKEVCPFPFMYMHFNWDGSVSPCTLDWKHKVIIGDANKESAVEIWNGKKLKDLRIKMLKGKRKEIPFCNKCLAPMVCCEEDLDNDTEELLRRIK